MAAAAKTTRRPQQTVRVTVPIIRDGKVIHRKLQGETTRCTALVITPGVGQFVGTWALTHLGCGYAAFENLRHVQARMIAGALVGAPFRWRFTTPGGARAAYHRAPQWLQRWLVALARIRDARADGGKEVPNRKRQR